MEVIDLTMDSDLLSIDIGTKNCGFAISKTTGQIIDCGLIQFDVK